MKSDEMLPRETVWDGAHVSDVALTAIADGQEAIVGRAAVEHVDLCEWCAGRLGRAALLSAAVAEAMAEQGPAAARAASRAKAPWRTPLALGLAVAFAAALPMLASAARVAAFLRAFVSHAVPVLARGGAALAASPATGRLLPIASLVSSVLLVVMGFAIARARPAPAAARTLAGGSGS
jgi:hypothetical protein